MERKTQTQNHSEILKQIRREKHQKWLQGKAENDKKLALTALRDQQGPILRRFLIPENVDFVLQQLVAAQEVMENALQCGMGPHTDPMYIFSAQTVDDVWVVMDLKAVWPDIGYESAQSVQGTLDSVYGTLILKSITTLKILWALLDPYEGIESDWASFKMKALKEPMDPYKLNVDIREKKLMYWAAIPQARANRLLRQLLSGNGNHENVDLSWVLEIEVEMGLKWYAPCVNPDRWAPPGTVLLSHHLQRDMGIENGTQVNVTIVRLPQPPSSLKAGLYMHTMTEPPPSDLMDTKEIEETLSEAIGRQRVIQPGQVIYGSHPKLSEWGPLVYKAAHVLNDQLKPVSAMTTKGTHGNWELGVHIEENPTGVTKTGMDFVKTMV
jgi:hypothetical protein